MKKIGSLLAIVLCGLTICVLTTGIHLVTGTDSGLLVSQIDNGHVHRALLSRTFWSVFPQFSTSIKTYVHVPSLLIAGIPLWGVLYVLGSIKRSRSLILSLACLICGIIPYGLGLWALQAANLPAGYEVRWLLVMLLGLLYCAATALVFALMDMVNMNLFKALARVPHPRVTFTTATN